MKNKLKITNAFLLSLMLFSLVGAAGVTSPYWEGNPMNAQVGTTTTVDIVIQNMVGEEDLTFEAVVTEGNDIASISKTTYKVPANTKDTIAPIKIKISKDTELGSTQKVKIEFKTVSEGDSGMVTLGTGMTVSFDVIAVENTKETPILLYSIIGAIILILIIVGIIIAAKKKKKK